jgi:hypothetical protein
MLQGSLGGSFGGLHIAQSNRVAAKGYSSRMDLDRCRSHEDRYTQQSLGNFVGA